MNKGNLGWYIVEEQINLNKQKRINWVTVLGMSLTKAVAKFKMGDLPAEFCYEEICKTHLELTDEMKRRLKIGICARYGEMGTALGELSK